MKKLEITAEKIKAGAEKCPEAKEVLEEMFPEAFKDDKYFELDKLKINKHFNEFPIDIFTNKSCIDMVLDNQFIQIRQGGEYQNKAFYLSNCCNWEIIKDAQDLLCLVPTKK